MWLPFVEPCKMMTHPGYFSTYSSCQHPTILGTEALLLFSLRHANGVVSSVAPGRQGKRDLEAQPASERCLYEGVLWGCVLPSILKPLLLLFFPAYAILSSICQLFHVVWDNIALFFPSPGTLFSEAVTPTYTTLSVPWDPLWAANSKRWRCCSRGESGLGRGDYAAHRRESSLLSHKAVNSAVRERLPVSTFPHCASK